MTQNGTAVAESQRQRSYWAEEIFDLCAPDWLVSDTIPAVGVGFLYGPSGVGKTFLALHLARCVERGDAFFGREMVFGGGGTYMVAAEGFHALSSRLAGGYVHLYGDASIIESGDVPFKAAPEPPDLLSETGIQAFIDELRTVSSEMKTRHRAPLRLVVFDTFSAAFRLEDENSSSEAGRVLRALRRVSSELEIVVLVVHHAGKKVESGMRGSSRLRADADFVIAVEKHRLKLEKCKDAPEGAIGSFRLQPIKVRELLNGGHLKTCYVEEVSEGELEAPKAAGEDRNVARLCSAIESVIRMQPPVAEGEPATAQLDAVREVFYAAHNGKPSARRKAFNRAMKSARETGHVAEVANGDTRGLLLM